MKSKMSIALTMLLVVIVALSVWPIAGRAHILPDVISEDGALIDRQIYTTLFVCGTIFVVAQLALAWMIFRYARKEGAKAYYYHGNLAFEISVMVLMLILFESLTLGGQGVWANLHLKPVPQGKDVLRVEVDAQQFQWSYRYPGKDGQFAPTDVKWISDPEGNYIGLDEDTDDFMEGTLRVPVDTPVVLTIKSRDVLHSFFVRELRLKQDAVPGLAIQIPFKIEKARLLKFHSKAAHGAALDQGRLPEALRAEFTQHGLALTPDSEKFQVSVTMIAPGRRWKILDKVKGYIAALEESRLNIYCCKYEVACAELCGPNHWAMSSTLEVYFKEDFQKWITQQNEEYAGE